MRKIMFIVWCVMGLFAHADGQPTTQSGASRNAYLQAPGMEITCGEPALIFFPDQPATLTVSVQPPPDGAAVVLTGRVACEPSERRRALIDLGPISLKPENDYRRVVDLAVADLGYYSVTWTLACGSDTASPGRTTFAVIPRNAQDRQRWESPFGVNTHRWWRLDRILPIVQRIGIAWIRDHMNTGLYDKGTGTYTGDDPVLRLAERHELCFLPLSEYFQRACPDGLIQRNGKWVMPEAARQVEAYARRHRGRIRHFEVYNEPHGWGWGKRFDPDGVWWQGGKWVQPFVDFAITQARAIHRGDPDIKVLWPEMDIFLHQKLFAQAGAGPDVMQIIAPHTYNIHDQYPEHQPYVTGMPATLEYMREHGMTDEVWVTELGWSTFTTDKPLPDDYVGYWPQSERQQAEKLARIMILHRAVGIAKTFWYDFYEDGFDNNNAEHRFGLIRANPLYPANPGDDVAEAENNIAVIRHRTFQPKPAAIAYANIIHWLEGARYLGRCASGACAYAFRQANAEAPVVVAWFKNRVREETWRIDSDISAVTLTDIYGRSRSVAVKDKKLILPLDESPVLITGLTTADVNALLVSVGRETR